MLVKNRIRTIRKQNGLTLIQLAFGIGVTPDAIVKWESYKRQPGVDNLYKISVLVGCKFDDLLEFPKNRRLNHDKAN